MLTEKERIFFVRGSETPFKPGYSVFKKVTEVEKKESEFIA
jgi:hypothetical protein